MAKFDVVTMRIRSRVNGALGSSRTCRGHKIGTQRVRNACMCLRTGKELCICRIWICNEVYCERENNASVGIIIHSSKVAWRFHYRWRSRKNQIQTLHSHVMTHDLGQCLIKFVWFLRFRDLNSLFTIYFNV